MQTAAYVQALIDDLFAIAAVGPSDGETDSAVRRLTRALEASAGQRFLDAVSDAAIELSAQLPSGHLEVRLVGRDVELVHVEEEEDPEQAVPGAEDPTTARISLRLPDSLKSQVEAAATREGVSTNTWIVRALGRSLTGSRTRTGNRLTGFARS